MAVNGTVITRLDIYNEISASTEAEKLHLTLNEVKSLTDLFFDQFKNG
jgi:hypothetical protein